MEKLDIVDADGHVFEPDRELYEFLEPPYRGKQTVLGFSLWPSLDGYHRGAIHARLGTHKAFDTNATTWINLLDATGIATSVLYPTAGLASAFIKDLRAGFSDQGGDLDRASVAFTEGGGGAMFWELSRISGGALEHRIAAIFKEIYQDELSHGWPHLEEIARHARCEADWLRAEAIICDISRQRLRMRNEMFGHSLATTRVREIDEGRIEPWMAPGVI